MRRHLLATIFIAFALPATAQTFTVSASGGFAAPDGQRWNMRGLNAGVQDALQGSDFPGLTAIRLNVNPSSDSAASISQVVSEYTAAGVAVEIEDPSGNGDNVAWYQQEAQQFKANALVFLETPNEPSGSAQQVAQDQTGIIKAIRATGFSNPIGVQPADGFDQSNIPAVTAAVGTGNLYVTPHIYYGGTDPNGAANYVQSEIGQAQSNGLFSVIDEFGNAMDGVNQNPQGNSVITSVTAANHAGEAGAIFWGMDNGNHPDGTDSAFATPDGSKLTPMGAQLQSSFLAPQAPSTVRLTSVAPTQPGAIAPTFQATPSAGAQSALKPVTLLPAPQFAAEPQVAVSPLQCGLFGVTGGQIFGPSGQPFVSQGISLLDSEMGEVSPEQIISQFSNVNTVNLAVGADGDGYATARPNSAIINWVNDATSHGLVVILSDYVPGQPEARSGADLQASLNWYASLAKTFANNPHVMWTTENEVSGSLSQEEQGIYNAIRGAGNDSIIFMEAQDGNATTTAGLDPSIYANMTGVAWNIHAYPWEFNSGSGSQAGTLESYVAMFQNFAHSADGVMPVLIGEGGNATVGNNVDDTVVNGKFATTQVIIDTAGVAGGTTGYEMWLDDWHGTGGGADELVGSNGALTAYGQQVAAGMLPANQPPVCTESPSLASQPITSLGPALNMPGVPSSD